MNNEDQVARADTMRKSFDRTSARMDLTLESTTSTPAGQPPDAPTLSPSSERPSFSKSNEVESSCGCMRKAVLGRCDEAVDAATGKCPRGSHALKDLEESWLQHAISAMDSPYANASIEEIIR